MKVLENDELMHVNGGGGVFLQVAAGFAAVGIFLIGVLDGFLRPLACNK